MKAAFFRKYGDASVMEFGDQPDPTPEGHFALVSLKTIGLNHVDIWIRNGIPEIKFRVLVSAEQPDQRFVLIGGERMSEGDELPSGPKIEEIRRNGVIFSYRLYQFLVER